jgi:hypothetical protein
VRMAEDECENAPLQLPGHVAAERGEVQAVASAWRNEATQTESWGVS